MRTPPPSQSWLALLLRQLSHMSVLDVLRIEKDRPSAIHSLRVRMKKLDSLILLMTNDRKSTDLQPVSEQIHKIKIGVAGSRDQVVMARVAAKLSPTPLPLLPFPKLSEWSANRLLRETRELESRVRALRLPRRSRIDILRHHVKAYQRARQSLKKCSQSDASDDFHRWRKRVKILHFQSLALHAQHPAGKLAQPMIQLGKILGRDHDLVLILDHFQDTPSGRKWTKRIQRKLDLLRQKALRYGREYLSRLPHKFSLKLGIPPRT